MPSGAPGVGAMTDTLEFVKNMWGGMKIPGMAMPSMSVDDINKQIADLKAVESWLTLNMNMLRGTIQALEVQSATIATLQAMSANMSSMMQGNQTETKDKPDFVSPFSSAASGTEKPSASGAAPQSQPASDASTGAAPPFANPAIWWNLLQDQFKQAVNSAIVPEPPEPPAAAKPAPSPKRKPSPKP
ncbi:MAG: hypothetical protein A3I66_07575 [Burkholderiales bacterium RIFCSPLOWO2_02_FULL_57_36]|nr:MAG: hypothetical protein A3I66_07575 [Burkholderiales bacterium RIFCSPLOWO2_02_FULL_57_36]